MPEEAARVAGLQAGEYNYLEEIIPDQIAVLQDSPGVTIEILPPRSYGIIIMNTAGGLFTDQTLRQAVQAAIEVESSGQATHGEGYFELGPGIMLPQTIWALGCFRGALQPEQPREGGSTAGGGGLRRHAHSPPLHPGGSGRLQRRRRGAAAARAGRVHGRAGGERRGDARGEPGRRRAVGHDHERHRVPTRSGPDRPLRELHAGRQVVHGRERSTPLSSSCRPSPISRRATRRSRSCSGCGTSRRRWSSSSTTMASRR